MQNPRRVHRHLRAEHTRWYYASIGANVTDKLTTALGLYVGGSEWNPIVSKTILLLGLVNGLVVAALPGVLLSTLLYLDPTARSARKLLYLRWVTIAHAAPVVWNLTMLAVR
jgi:hypothetical protein